MKKILISSVVLGVIAAYLTKDKWMLPFIKINMSGDGKSYQYELYANGNTVKGIAPMNPASVESGTIKKEIGVNEFKIYAPFSGQIRAYIYEEGTDNEIASSIYDIKTKTVSTFYQKSYLDMLKKVSPYAKYASIAALLYMGFRLNYDNVKKHSESIKPA